MTHTLSDWVRVIACQIEDGSSILTGICRDLEKAPTVKSGDQLPDLPPGFIYKIVPWGLDV
ncbi:MAG: hypothetical protein INF44_02675 [Thalassospira sp.]|jgi:hypothetical protein|nr:hypothetical protein [Thalassospira sp.]